MKYTNESGRSMVEMLGVLAIIGVLSVGGIAGYTQAIKKYKANEATKEIVMAAVTCFASKDHASTALNGFEKKYTTTLTCDASGCITWEVESGVESSIVQATLGDNDKVYCISTTSGGTGSSGGGHATNSGAAVLL